MPWWTNLISWAGEWRRKEGRMALFPLALFHVSVCNSMSTLHSHGLERWSLIGVNEVLSIKERGYFKTGEEKNKTLAGIQI